MGSTNQPNPAIGLRSGADAREHGTVPQYATRMKGELLSLGQSEEQAEKARRKILVQFADGDKLIAEISAAITEANAMWERGEACSPSQLDYVLDADRILTRGLPGYNGSTDEGREFLADLIYDDAGETLLTADDIAGAIFDALTAE